MENWIPTIVTLVVLVLGGLGLLIVIKKSLSEIIEFLTAISQALEDNKISPEELTKITKEFKDILASFKKNK